MAKPPHTKESCLNRFVVSRLAVCTLGIGALLAACAPAPLSTTASRSSVRATDESVLFSSNWREGIDSRIQLQRASEKAIEIVGLPGGRSEKALRMSISRSGDFSQVANGTPRAEISFGGFLHFERGHEYTVQWQMRLPDDYQFDSRQDEVIGQIHQGPAAGYPPFALFISESGQYEVHSRTQSERDYVTRLFGAPQLDRGRVVDWRLVYVPDPSGRQAKTELYKDGAKVFSLIGIPNAYIDDDRAYFKLGIYKAHWQRAPSDVDIRTIEFGALSISERIN